LSLSRDAKSVIGVDSRVKLTTVDAEAVEIASTTFASMRAGSFAAYDVAYYDPHEVKARREKWVERRNNEYLEDAGRGNLVVTLTEIDVPEEPLEALEGQGPA